MDFTGGAAEAAPHYSTTTYLPRSQSIERFTTLETEPCVKGSLGFAYSIVVIGCRRGASQRFFAVGSLQVRLPAVAFPLGSEGELQELLPQVPATLWILLPFDRTFHRWCVCPSLVCC